MTSWFVELNWCYCFCVLFGLSVTTVSVAILAIKVYKYCIVKSHLSLVIREQVCCTDIVLHCTLAVKVTLRTKSSPFGNLVLKT